MAPIPRKLGAFSGRSPHFGGWSQDPRGRDPERHHKLLASPHHVVESHEAPASTLFLLCLCPVRVSLCPTPTPASARLAVGGHTKLNALSSPGHEPKISEGVKQMHDMIPRNSPRCQSRACGVWSNYLLARALPVVNGPTTTTACFDIQTAAACAA